MGRTLSPRRDSINAMDRRAVMMSRVLRAGQKDDGAFDRDFWRKVGPEGIFEAAWDMVREHRVMRGEAGNDDGDEPRLQRSVLRVIRRGR